MRLRIIFLRAVEGLAQLRFGSATWVGSELGLSFFESGRQPSNFVLAGVPARKRSSSCSSGG